MGRVPVRDGKLPRTFRYLYVPNRLMVQGDALATADLVRASEGLLRAAIGAELYGLTVLLFSTMPLYETVLGAHLNQECR